MKISKTQYIQTGELYLKCILAAPEYNEYRRAVIELYDNCANVSHAINEHYDLLTSYIETANHDNN